MSTTSGGISRERDPDADVVRILLFFMHFRPSADSK